MTSLFLFDGCESPRHTEKKAPQKPRFIHYDVSSYRQTLAILDHLGYTDEAFRAGMKVVPRVLLTRISSRWSKEASDLPVAEKKSLFLRLLASGALIADEEVMREREKMLEILEKIDRNDPPNRRESEWLRRLALKYGVLKTPEDILTRAKLKLLKRRVDIVPPSLILAQGAVESAWGTSRFAVEGNALFGQWSFSKAAMKPKRQRKSLGDYGLARFKTPLDSIRAYIHNLNTHPAYRIFRQRRAKLRDEGKPLRGMDLAPALLHYSEQGERYVEKLLRIIEANHLAWLDDAKLSETPPIYIHPDR